MAKRGRPLAGAQKKRFGVFLRMSKGEKALVMEKAAAAQKPLAQYLRERGLA